MNWIKNLILIILSLIFSYFLLIIGDWYINKDIKSQTNDSWSEAKKIIDTRSREEDLPQRQKAIDEGYLPIIYTSVQDDQLNTKYPLIAGLPNTKTYYCNEGYGLVKYKSDRFGFRNQDSFWDTKNADLVIGDSYVHGACVDNHQTLSSYVTYFSKVKTLNLGIGGNNPSHYITYSKLFIPRIKPKRVYLVFYPNDFGIMGTSAIENAYIQNDNKLFSHNKLELFNEDIFIKNGLKLISAKKRVGDNNKINSFFKRLGSAFKRHSNLPTINELIFNNKNHRFKKTKETIITTSKLCKKYSCKLFIVFIPNSKFFNPNYLADEYGNLINNLASSLSLPFIDGRKFLDQSRGSEDYAIKGPHLSPDGYKKTAKIIFNTFSKF